MPRAAVPIAAAADEIDLDSALDQLDVDLGIEPDDAAPPPPPPPPVRRKGTRPLSDDGIPIDFDDDD
jgi:hypothetical protein